MHVLQPDHGESEPQALWRMVQRFCRRAGASLLSGGAGVLVCRIPSLALAEETYSIDLWLAYRGGLADYVTRVKDLRVVTAQFFETGQEPVKRKHGAALIRHEWSATAAAMEETGALMDAVGRA